MECLRLAALSEPSATKAIDAAEKFEAFIFGRGTKTSPSPETVGRKSPQGTRRKG
jgi:hypothetical protein